jgi:hypothetical protein
MEDMQKGLDYEISTGRIACQNEVGRLDSARIEVLDRSDRLAEWYRKIGTGKETCR